jgi:Putative peptidoglycan binding domain.
MGKMAGAGFLVFLILTLATYHLAFLNKIYPGITIVGQPVGIRPLLRLHQSLVINHRSSSHPEFITLFSGEQQWQVNLEQGGFSYNATASAQKAYQIGRSSKPISDLKVKLKSWLEGTNIGLEYSLNQDALESQIATISAQIFVPAIEPTIKALESTPSGERSRI